MYAVVPGRGYAKWDDAENIEFFRIAASFAGLTVRGKL